MMSALSPNDLTRTLSQREIDDMYSDPNLRLSYGIPPDLHDDANTIAGGGNIFAGLPVAASRGEFYEAVKIFASESGAFLSPDDAWLYGNQNPSAGYYYNNLAGSPMPNVGTNNSPGTPAPLTEVPTSSINPERPRTVAAGYDGSRRTLTVVFRDGTYYNYYEVAPLEWANFKRARSKGRFIYTYLDAKPRGVADVSQLSSAARESLYRVSRTGQIKRGGITGKQSATSKRGKGYGSKTGGVVGPRGGKSLGGGTGRSRNKPRP